MHLLKTGLDHSLTYRNPLSVMASKHLDHIHKSAHTQVYECRQIIIYSSVYAGALTHALYHTKRNIFPCVYV